jgi:hypothetical protein
VDQRTSDRHPDEETVSCLIAAQFPGRGLAGVASLAGEIGALSLSWVTRAFSP